MMIYQLIIQTLLTRLNRYTPLKQLSLPHFLAFTSNLTPMVVFLPDTMTKETIIIWSIFHLLILNVQYDTKLKRQCKKTFSSEKSNRDTKVGNTKRNIAVLGGL
jgi:hypothetical protein